MTSWACRGDELGQQPTNRAGVGGVAPTRVLIGGPRTPGIADVSSPDMRYFNLTGTKHGQYTGQPNRIFIHRRA